MSAEAAALQQLRGLVAALGAGDAAALRDGTVTSLRAAANAVSRLARDASPELARGSWETALELWNVVVTLSNATPAAGVQAARCAQLRAIASDVVHANKAFATSADAAHTLAYFAVKTGETFYKAGALEQAEAAFEQATSDCEALSDSARDKELCAALFCARARCAWSLKRPDLARALLERAADAAARLSAGATPAVAAAASERLAGVHFDLARSCLTADDGASAAQLLQAAVMHAAAARATGVLSAARLHLKALQCLAVAHLKAGSHASALNCARVLAEHAATASAGDGGIGPAAASAGRAARFLCINALCGLSRVEEAVEMLAAAADNADGAAELYAESAISVMRAGRPDAATSAIGNLLAAGGTHAHAAVRFFEAALGDEHGRVPALALLAVPDVAAVLKDGADGDKRTLHLQALLWNTATQQFEAKNYAGARELFSAASSYARAGDPNRARAARAACLCLLALRQPEEALPYILLADQLESGEDAPQPSVQTRFLKLKVHLEQGMDDEGALAALHTFTQCADFDIDFLYLAALESQSKSALRCAQEAYTLLYREVTTPGTNGAAKAASCPGYFAQLLRHLVKVTSAKWDAADAVGGGVPDPARSAELAQQMGVASERLKALGVPAFAGKDPATAARELQWFATTAWNAGLAASVELAHDWASAARLFAAAGAFMDAADAPPYRADGGSAAHESAAPSRRLAWLLAAGAALEVHTATLENEADAAVVLGEAQHALDRCAAAAEAAAALANDGGRTDIFFALLSFTASTRAGDEAGSLALLRKVESMPGLSADAALKLARLAATAAAASEGGPLVAFRAYELCLRVMQRSPSASLKDISYALRKVVTLAEQAGAGGSDNRDARLLRAFRDATAVLAAAPAGAYPSEEAVWLVTTAWNRGALLAKLGRAENAEPLLKCSLEMLKHGVKHAPALDAHKASMEDTLAALGKKKRRDPAVVTRDGGDDPIVLE